MEDKKENIKIIIDKSIMEKLNQIKEQITIRQPLDICTAIRMGKKKFTLIIEDVLELDF